jgi:hypothetical protein
MTTLRLSIDQLRLRAQLLYDKQGVLPFIAAALSLLAMLIGVLLVLAGLVRQQQAQSATPASLRRSPVQRLNSVLADPEKTNEQIRTLLDLAVSTGVTVMQADYRRVAEARAPTRGGTESVAAAVPLQYSQLQISLPVKADYLSLRRFLYTALAQMPALSLDQLILKREQVSAAQIDAQLVLSLWQRAPTVGGGN